eukprot:6205064-Pleurochrysis_carterae.AAC.1
MPHAAGRRHFQGAHRKGKQGEMWRLVDAMCTSSASAFPDFASERMTSAMREAQARLKSQRTPNWPAVANFMH